MIEHVFFPVFPPDRHADVVLDWLRDNPSHGERRGATTTV